MYILFDVGGSKIRIASSRNLKTFSEPLILKTPKNFKEGIEAFKEAIAELSKNEKIQAIAGGTPGYFNKNKTKIIGSAENIKNWIGKPLVAELKKITHSPTLLENDADLVGLGEAVYGSGKGYNCVAYLTISTGVGGGRIFGGQIDPTLPRSEPGDQLIGNNSLEDLIAGKSIEKKYHKKPYEILDEKFWDKMARFLAIGINNTVAHWNPDVVIIGGSMMKRIGIKIPQVKNHLNRITVFTKKNIPLPKIKEAALGDYGGLYGAMALLKQKKINKKRGLVL